MRLRTMVRYILLGGVLSVFGCGGGGGNSSGSGGGLTGDQRAAALAAIGAEWNTLPHTSRLADANAMAAFLKSRPEFSDAGVGNDLTVWALFRDGVPFGMMLNDPEMIPDGSDLLRSVRTRVGTVALPGGASAAMFNIFATEEAGIGQMVNMLGNRGYKPFSMNGQLADFENLIGSGTALIMTSTHGGYMQDKNRNTHYYLRTAQYFNPADDQPGNPIHTDLESGALALAGEMVGKQWRGIYCIGPGFVLNHMSFGKDSVWINSACEGFDSEFSTACFQKGLTAYTGWTDSVHREDATRAALFLVDRLSGSNQDSAYTETPPQRPFDLQSVLSNMSQTPGSNPVTNPTLDHSLWLGNGLRVTNAFLKSAYSTYTPSEQFGLLAPSIEEMTVNESKGTLTLTGEFGPDPGSGGQVTVNGTPLTLAAGGWQPGGITCNLPPSGPGSAGPVLVTVRGHKSNPRELTAWQGAFKCTQQINSVTIATATFNVLFRADVGDVRSGPHQTPVHVIYAAGGAQFYASRSATFSYAITGGTVTDSDGCTYTFVQNGSPSVPYQTPDQLPLPTSFEFYGRFKQDASGNLTLYLDTIEVSVDQGEGIQSSCFNGQSNGTFGFNISPNPLKLNGYNIPAGSYVQPPYPSGVGTNLMTTNTISWSTIPAISPPNPNDPLAVRHH